MSQRVAALEREVGLPLVERGTRPVELTEAGHALTRHATGIFARLDGAEQELGEIAGRRHGRLRFGSFPTPLATFVPPAFARFRRGHPDVTLTVVDDHLQRLIPRLEAGELDLALIYDHEALPEIAGRDLERIPLLDDVFRAVLPAGHRLFAPKVGFASDDPIAIQALVAAGLGVSVIPGLAVAHPLPGLEVRTLAPRAPARHISAARPRDAYHGPAVTAMLDSLRAAAQALMVTAHRHDGN